MWDFFLIFTYLKHNINMTIIDLIREKFISKNVKISKITRKEVVELHTGKVMSIYVDGDRYSGYEICFTFDDKKSFSIDLDETEIKIIE